MRLASNPTTGYQCSVLGNTAPLKFVKSTAQPTPQAAVRMGAGGTQTLRFNAQSSGKVELKLGYQRQWEKNTPPAKTFLAVIVVR